MTLIATTNASLAWAKMFIHANSPKSNGPVVVTIDGFSGELPPEHPPLANALNAALIRAEQATIEQTALTIFPFRQWTRRNRPSIDAFSEFYMKEFFPRAKALNRKNARGTYFQRMISYSGLGKRDDGESGPKTVNQLKEVIEFWRGANGYNHTPRTSATQVAIFDPAKDHTGSPLQGFPCLQQVGFAVNEQRELQVNAFYPSQYVVDRAYGNYRGLCQLGVFVAQEVDLRFSTLTCFVSRPLFGTVKKTDLSAVKALATDLVATTGSLSS